MTLPYPPRRALRRSLWIVVHLIAAIFVAGAAAWLGGALWAASAGLLVLVSALLGRHAESLQIRLYEQWNRRMRMLGRAGEKWTLFLSYRMVLPALGNAGSKFERANPASASSSWRQRNALADGPDAGGGPIDHVGSAGWLGRLVASSRRGDARWLILMVPFVWMLALYECGDEGKVSHDNIYTLF